MRINKKASYNVAGTVNFPWWADSIHVVNPTQYTLCLRIGSDNAPTSILNADEFVPPLSMRNIPVQGNLFGWLLTAPQLSNPAPGMPTEATITFAAGERDPAYGSLQFASVYLSNAQELVHEQPIRAAGNYTDGPYPVSSNMRTLYAYECGADITSMSVYGAQSGYRYFICNPSLYAAISDTQIPTFVSPFLSAIDSQVYINTFSTGPSNGYEIYAGAEYSDGQVTVKDRRQMVEVRPPGQSSLPVSVSNDLLSGGVVSSQITLPNNTPTLLLVIITRRLLVVRNTSPVTIYRGGAGVNATNGVPMAVNDEVAYDADLNFGLYAYQNSGVSRTINILEAS